MNTQSTSNPDAVRPVGAPLNPLQIQELFRKGFQVEAHQAYITHPNCVNPQMSIGRFVEIMRAAIQSSHEIEEAQTRHANLVASLA